MTTTAEGVETEQQRNLLYILGCTEMQGYLFSPAIPAADVRRLLLSHRGTAVVGGLKRRPRLAIDGCCNNKKQGRVERDEPRHRVLSELARPSALAPFRIRNYRFQWPADLLTSWAFEMETLILGWYVLVETGSVLLLTVFASLGYVGTLVAPMFGVVGDRIGHRDLLAMMRATYAVLAADADDAGADRAISRRSIVFIVAALMGIVRPSDLGVRGALVATIMPHDQLIGAISISRTTMDTARIAGALSGAGLFASLGMGPAYVAIVCLYIASTALTLCVVAPAKPHPADEAANGALRRSPLRDLKEGVAYVWTTPRMRAALWIAFLANLTAYPLTNGLLPYIAREIYGTNQTGLGYLSASFAIGSLVGSIALEPDRRHPGGAADDRRHRRCGTRRCWCSCRCRPCRPRSRA